MLSRLRLPALVAVLAVALAVMALVGVGAAHAQQVDDSLPPRADLSLRAENSGSSSARARWWTLTVENNRVGDHPPAHVRNVKVRFSVENVAPGPQVPDIESYFYLEEGHDGYFDRSSLIWTIPELPPYALGAVARFNGPFLPFDKTPSEPNVVRIKAEIIGSEPAEPAGFHGNNALEFWYIRDYFAEGNAGVTTSVSDRHPGVGGATTFTVHATNRGTARSTPSLPVFVGGAGGKRDLQLGVRVKIGLSPGLTFAGTPQAPSGTTFDPATGIWDVGAMSRDGTNDYAFPVAVNLTNDSLTNIPLEERCLTARVVRAVPWFAFDSTKRENDVATTCLGERHVLLTEGEVTLLDFYPCVGVTTTPCTGADTLELVAVRSGRYHAAR